MSLEEIIKSDTVLCNAHARSKKHCLEILSELLGRATPGIASEDIFESLIGRERLGCTSLDNGVAFPHCRVKGLDKSTAALIKLSEVVDFDSPDGEPVDLIFGLMVPKVLDASHHADIFMITALLSDHALRARLRDTTTSSDLFDVLLRGSVTAADDDLKTAQGS